jgi:hypothetical protein
MNNQNNYEEEDNRSTIKIIINDISTFLYKSGFLSKYLVDKKQIELLESNSKNDIIDIFEYNRSISSLDVSKKYNHLISSINSLFKSDLQYTFETLYYQYLEYTKTNISVNTYLNSLIMLNYIVNNFGNLLNLSDNYNFIQDFQLEQKISIIELNNLDNINSKNETISSKLEKIYENINKNPIYKDVPVNKYLIILIYLLSLDGKIIIDRDIPNLSNLIAKFSIYNRIYISNIYISIMQYIQMVLIINLYIKSNKSKKNFLVYNISHSNHYYDFAINETISTPNTTNIKTNNYYNKTQLLSTGRQFNYNLNDNNLMKIDDDNQKENNNYEIPNCYLFDDEIIHYPDNNGIKLIFFQNFLKFFSFYHLSKNKIKFTMNLSIESICELSKHFINKKEESNNDKPDIVIFEELDDLLLKVMNINDLELLTKDNINIFFNSFNFKEFLIKFMDFKSQQQVEIINNKYLELVSKSNNCYLQEPIISLVNDRKDSKHKTYNIVENLTMKDLYVQYNILIYYLEFFHKNKDLKKAPKTIIVKFNTFKFIFNRENKKIQIFFNFSSIKEKTLFHYLKISSNILKLEQKYEEIISYLKEYKLYDSTIRLYQTNFRSHQVSFFFTLITKKLADFLEDNKYNNKITIIEMKFNSFNPNMQVYIRDENMKQKNRNSKIKEMISNNYYSSKLNVLNNYIDELSQYWNLIVISDKDSDFKLLRTFEDNKIFFYISKDKSSAIYNSISGDNTTSVSSSNANNEEKKNEGYEYLNVIMYFKNDDQIFEKGLQFMDNLQDDKNSVLEYKTTLICDRFYLESNILTEPRMKKTVKTMYNVIDDLFMIAKNIKIDNDGNEGEENDQDNDYFNYDVYIADNFIAVSNYHLYDSKKDTNYSKVIFEFLSILSSCVELILYILKNKDIYISKFVYLIRTTKDDYYFFEYKNSNMFIKKVKEFDSLMTLNVKECYPLFCFISKKTETKYTISNDNFYDVYLRLFLNLNKVVETREKLNEIFLQKVHKNIFYEYYDSFLLIAYSFEAFNYFNDFLMKNNYLSITKGEKFDKCFIILSEEISRKKNYRILLDNLKTNNNIIAKKLILFNFNFIPSYFLSHRKLFFMSYQKAEYLINEEINQVKQKIIPALNNNLAAISKIFYNKNLDKDKIKNIVGRIKNFMVGEDSISLYNSKAKDFENILEDYYKEKAKIKTQKVEMRVYQLTEEAKNTQSNKLNHKKKDCEIF